MITFMTKLGHQMPSHEQISRLEGEALKRAGLRVFRQPAKVEEDERRRHHPAPIRVFKRRK